MKKLKVGIAGFGIVGRRRKDFICQNPHLKLVAVCDKIFTETQSFDNDVQAYNNYKDLLNHDLDILFVCLTNDVATEVTCAGLRKGLHVFCEKPPGRDMNDMRKLKQCHLNHPSLKLKFGFNHRYHDSVAKTLEIIKSNELGRIINMRAVYGKSQLITFGQSDWRTKRNIAGGGVLLDQGIHMVDLLRLIGGEFETVHSFISNDFWKYDVEDNAYALMKTKSNVVAMLHSSATEWRHRFNLDINLSKGHLVLGGILSGSKSYGAETLKIAWANKDNMGDPFENLIRYNQDNSWKHEIDEFTNCIIRNENVIHGSFDDAFKTMDLVYRIYNSDPNWQSFCEYVDNKSLEYSY